MIFKNYCAFFLLSLLVLVQNESGAQNVALNFDGTDDYIQTGFPGIKGAASRTVEAWVRTNVACDPNFGGDQQVICDWGSATTGGRFTLNLLFNNALRIELNGSGLSGTKAVNDGKWHHVAVVYDSGKSSPFSLYVDGVLDVNGTITTAINTTQTNNFMIGRRVDNVKYFEGDIDEVRVYNFAKTDTMINLDKNREFCIIPKGLVAYYKLNEGVPGADNRSKTTAFDYSGNAYHGTITNFTLRTTPSNFTNGPSLSGGNTGSNLNAFACSSYLSPSGKHTWTSSGNYKDTLKNSNSCDSILSIKLTIGKSNQSYAVSACDSFVSPAAKVYYVSGTYTETYPSYKNCDSVVNYVLSILKGKTKTIQVSSCDSFKSPKGNTYFTDGVYTEMYKTFQNCDSVVHYDVKVNSSKRSVENIVACDSVWYENKKYTGDTLFYKPLKTIHTCDSLHLVDIKIRHSAKTLLNHSACDSFISATGQVYKQSGTYLEKFQTYQTCDSVVHYQLTIYRSDTSTENRSVCRRAVINGITYTSSQLVTYKTNGMHGCDSLVHIQLEVIHLDTGLSRVDNVLSSNQLNASYTWLDCDLNTALAGENKISFKSSYDGRFAVALSKDNCKDTSACYHLVRVGLKEIHSANLIRIQPNPNTGRFEIEVDDQLILLGYFITDVNGRVVLEGKPSNDKLIRVDSPFTPGLYILHIQGVSETYQLKIRIE